MIVEPITNKIARVVSYFVPLGIVIVLSQKYLKATDSCGSTNWVRLYSMYGQKGFDGAEVMIRKENNP